MNPLVAVRLGRRRPGAAAPALARDSGLHSPGAPGASSAAGVAAGLAGTRARSLGGTPRQPGFDSEDGLGVWTAWLCYCLWDKRSFQRRVSAPDDADRVGTLPAIALTLAIGGAGLTALSIGLAQGRWPGWILAGALGMPVVAGLATIAGEAVLVGLSLLFDRGQAWHALATTSLLDILFLLPLSLAVGFLMGLLLFGGAGLIWARRLDQGD